MRKPKLPKSTIECPDCTKASGFPLGKAKGFSRRRFLQVGATGIVASYFLDVVNPRVLYGATRASNVYTRNTAKNAIFIFLSGAPSNIDTLRFPQGLLPKTAEHLDRLSFVRSGLAWAAVHQLGQVWAQIARNPGGATGSIAPHIGSVVSLEEQIARKTGDVLPGFIALNSFGIPAQGYFPAT